MDRQTQSEKKMSATTASTAVPRSAQPLASTNTLGQLGKSPVTESLSIVPRKSGKSAFTDGLSALHLSKTPFIPEKFESLYPKAQFVKPFQTLEIKNKKVYSFLLKPGQAIPR